MSDQPAVPESLLKILRCPVAVHEGEDTGHLRLYKDAWLISDESGNKYPIVNGIPVMLPDVGAKYKATAEDDLPVPPPSDHS